MTAEVLSGMAGSALSLVFKYVPWVRTKYAGASTTVKRLVMLLFIVLAAVVVYGLACVGWLQNMNWTLTCDEAGLTRLVQLVFAAAISNQTTFLIAPDKLDVVRAKNGRDK